MAYRSPFFVSHHALRTAGNAAVTVTNEAAGFPKYRLLDSRHDALFRFNTSAAGHTIVVDRGAGSLLSINRAVIPSGHNFSGASVVIESDDNAGFASATTMFTGTIPAGLFDQVLTASAERYMRLRVTSTGQWELSEFILSVTRTPTVGPTPKYTDEQFPTYSETVLRSGNAYRLQLGDDRQRFAVEWSAVPVAEVVSLFDLVWTESGQGIYPVWYGGADSTLAILPVLLTDQIERRQSSPVPLTSGLYFDVRVSMLEQLS